MNNIEAKDTKSVLKLFEKTVIHWDKIYKSAKEDLCFLSDKPEAQWDTADYQYRLEKKKPIVTVDILGQFINQVANNIRMNTPTINVIPSDSGSDEDTAGVFKGLIKNIEYHSNADDAYDTGSLNSIKCSIGYIRVNNKWSNDEETEQSLYIERVVNPLSVYLDPESVMPDGSDANYAFILDKISVADFKEKYDGKDPVSFEISAIETKKEICEDDDIQIVEYFQKTVDKQEIDGQIVKNTTIKRQIRSGADILEESIFPGKYIPLVPVYGEEAWENGERHINSLIRKAKSPQQMYNYWKSAEMEFLQKQPKAKWVVTEGAIEGYEEDWGDPDSVDVLIHNATDTRGNPVAPPQVIQPTQIPPGIVNAQRQAIDDIKASMGIYNAALGQASNETSGVAINARKIESNVTTYHYGDNLVRSITHVGRILVSAIPVVYDTPRVLRLIGEEEEIKQVGINGEITEEQERSFDLTQGKYDVRVTTGAGYTTQRQEAAELLRELITQRPDLTNVIGDIAFESMDIPGAKAIASRLKKLIDPKLLEDGESPQVMALQAQLQESIQALQVMEQQLVAMKGELDNKQASEQLKAQVEMEKVKSDRAKIELEVMKLQLDRDKQQADIALQAEELALKRQEMEIKAAQAQEKQDLDEAKLVTHIMERVRSEINGIANTQSLDNDVSVFME